MRLSHPEYIKQVKEFYQNKRGSNELSPLLANSTPANIKVECTNVYLERCEERDKPLLRMWFGPIEHGRKFLAGLKDFDINKFKGLNAYLKSKGETTISDKNIDLLAWLIDFPQRPYVYGKEVGKEVVENNNEDKENIIEEFLPHQEPMAALAPELTQCLPESKTEPPVIFSGSLKTGKSKISSTKVLIAFLILIIFIGGIYAFVQVGKSKEYMYWTGNQFEKLSDNIDANGKYILPMDEKKLKNFRKIVNTDSLTEQAIGKVYYIKDSNSIECYTEGGSYPEDPTRSLKKLSRHIFDKYIKNKSDSSKSAMADSQ